MADPPSHDPGIQNEPVFSSGPAKPDPSEAKAASRLAKAGPDAAHLQASQDVFDEPGMRVRPGEPIQRNWSCEGCGFNLRGLKVGNDCPECGRQVWLAPTTDASGTGYAAWLSRGIAQTGAVKSWAIVAGIALLGGPWSVLGALIATFSGLLALVVVGPAVEEVMKIALVALLIEIRPYFLRSRNQIFFAAAGSGLMFAVIENLIYLNIYIPNPSPGIIAWRWVVCTALHVSCSCVAAVGAVRVWDKVMDEQRKPEVPIELSWLVLAIVLHGGYNAAVTVAELSGFVF